MSKQQDLFERFNRATAAAELRFNRGVDEERRLVERVASEVPVDRYRTAKQMHFGTREAATGGVELIHHYDAATPPVTIHPHALRQLAERAPINLNYVKYLNSTKSDEDWKVVLLCENLNTLFHNNAYLTRQKQPMRFLHRRVGTQMRAFLSSSYNRHLVSAALLGPFLEAARAEGAKPVEAITSDIRISLKCYHAQPLEVMPGKYICVGAEWSNSDFGAGRLTVAQSIWDPLGGMRATLDETFSKVHLGPVIEGDTEVELPDSVNQQIVATQGSIIAATVQQMLQPESIERVLEGLRIAHKKEIDWRDLRGQLGKILGEKDLAQVEALINGTYEEGDLPPPAHGADGKPLMTVWWASELLSSFADKAGESEKKIELQAASGKVLAAAVKEKT